MCRKKAKDGIWPVKLTGREVCEYADWLERETNCVVLNRFGRDDAVFFMHYSDFFTPDNEERCEDGSCVYVLSEDCLKRLEAWPDVGKCVMMLFDPPLNYDMRVLVAAGIVEQEPRQEQETKEERKMPKKRCPNCGHEIFIVTAHVTQDWLVDRDGDFVECAQEAVEVTHKPDDGDIWTCRRCGYSEEGRRFNMDWPEDALPTAVAKLVDTDQDGNPIGKAACYWCEDSGMKPADDDAKCSRCVVRRLLAHAGTERIDEG